MVLLSDAGLPEAPNVPGAAHTGIPKDGHVRLTRRVRSSPLPRSVVERDGGETWHVSPGHRPGSVNLYAVRGNRVLTLTREEMYERFTAVALDG